jgi:hypothetical protein
VGRDVSVDDAHGLAGLGVAHLVGRVQAVGGAVHDVDAKDDGRGQARAPAVSREAAQVRPIDVLHGDEVAAVRLAEVEHLNDLRVVQLRAQARLVEDMRTASGWCWISFFMRLTTSCRENPCTPCRRARNTSAMPPEPIRRTSS